MFGQIKGLCFLGALVVGVGASGASASLIINGSFEINTAPGNWFNPINSDFNSVMSSVTAYGVRQGIDIQTIGSGWGQAPIDGNFKISPASDQGGNVEEFSMTLSSPLVSGNRYDLSFYMEALNNNVFNGGHVEVGASTSATSFGTLVYTSPNSSPGWTQYSTNFLAPGNSTYLTVRMGNDVSGWVGVDNFILNGVPEPTVMGLLGGAMVLLIRRRG